MISTGFSLSWMNWGHRLLYRAMPLLVASMLIPGAINGIPAAGQDNARETSFHREFSGSTVERPAANRPGRALLPTASDRAVDVEFSEATSVSNDDERITQDQFIDSIAKETLSLREAKLPASTLQTALIIGALSLAPAILLMTTSYVRIIVVLSLLRQALGAQQLPPVQVITALSIFMTIVVMTPVWSEVKREAIDPYLASRDSDSAHSWEEMWQNGAAPIKRFMLNQITIAGNRESLVVFHRYVHRTSSTELPDELEEIPLNVVLPAFMVSELKVAFLLGFQIFLPFLIVDLVVSAVSASMGMVMLPPTVISLPLKLVLFVMVDGWNLVVGMMLQSFGPFV